MRIDDSGNVSFAGQTASAIFSGTAGIYIGSSGNIWTTVGAASHVFTRGSDGSVIDFRRGTTTGVGSITTTATATAYNTSSDYRLKDNVQPLDAGEATDRIMAYEPCTWTWNIDGSYGKGFIAHKNQLVDPMTVTGIKDGTRRLGNIRLPDYTMVVERVEEPEDLTPYGEGAQWLFTEEEPVYQGRDDTKMIPDMIAMMQRMETRIRELEAQVAALTPS